MHAAVLHVYQVWCMLIARVVFLERTGHRDTDDSVYSGVVIRFGLKG